jgi:hypothetical protein
MKKILLLVVVAGALAVGGYMLTQGGAALPGGAGKTGGVPEGWKASVGDGISFSYPEIFDVSFIGTSIWPPQVYLLGDGPLTCEVKEAAGAAGQVTQKEVNGNVYCITRQSKEDTRSTTGQYAYTFEKEGKIITLVFGLRFVKCSNYELEKKGTCEIAQNAFSVDTIADTMAQSVKIGKIADAPDTTTAPAGS